MAETESGNTVDLLIAFNAGRAPDLLAMKYAKMAADPFVFLRGACHLFYPALPDDRLFIDAPLAWACGDLHAENYGSYKGDDRQACFDINDFDEAALAPCTWDPVRLLTSLLCGAEALKVKEAAALDACRAFLDAYREALSEGKPHRMDADRADGPIRDLLDSLGRRKRADFLDQRTHRHNGTRTLKADGRKALPVDAAQREQVAGFMAGFAATQSNPGFYAMLDVARRIAGTGSLGVERYVILVEGKGSPDGNYLIDLKKAVPSSLLATLHKLGVGQPDQGDAATRIVAIERRMQGVSHAFLSPVVMNDAAYILKGLQPSEDRLDLAVWCRDGGVFSRVAADMGRLLAWDQLRASGAGGAAEAEALAGYAGRPGWRDGILDAARTMRDTTRQQWLEFKTAYAAGRLHGGA